jgi:hypothetical protein
MSTDCTLENCGEHLKLRLPQPTVLLAASEVRLAMVTTALDEVESPLGRRNGQSAAKPPHGGRFRDYNRVGGSPPKV